MDADDQEKKPVDPEEAKRQAYRKLKPVGPVMKPLSGAELDEMLNDPEDKEREHLLDAMPKGREYDDQDGF